LSRPGRACDVVRRMLLAFVAMPHHVKDEAKLKTQ
jgi:hypothetical protein